MAICGQHHPVENQVLLNIKLRIQTTKFYSIDLHKFMIIQLFFGPWESSQLCINFDRSLPKKFISIHEKQTSKAVTHPSVRRWFRGSTAWLPTALDSAAWLPNELNWRWWWDNWILGGINEIWFIDPDNKISLMSSSWNSSLIIDILKAWGGEGGC